MNTLPPGSANALMTSLSISVNSHGSEGLSPSVVAARALPMDST